MMKFNFFPENYYILQNSKNSSSTLVYLAYNPINLYVYPFFSLSLPCFCLAHLRTTSIRSPLSALLEILYLSELLPSPEAFINSCTKKDTAAGCKEYLFVFLLSLFSALFLFPLPSSYHFSSNNYMLFLIFISFARHFIYYFPPSRVLFLSQIQMLFPDSWYFLSHLPVVSPGIHNP